MHGINRAEEEVTRGCISLSPLSPSHTQPWLQWCGRATLHPAPMGCMPGTVLWRAKSDKIEDVDFRSPPLTSHQTGVRFCFSEVWFFTCQSRNNHTFSEGLRVKVINSRVLVGLAPSSKDHGLEWTALIYYLETMQEGPAAVACDELGCLLL